MADPARAPLRSGAAVAAMIGIAAATALAYSNTMGASFQFDDVPNIVENTSLRDLSSLWPPSGRRWVGVLTFALNYRWGGLAVPGYHAVNLLIHLCNALLVSLLAATTLRTPAVRRAAIAPLVSRFLPVTSGLLFAIHPLATESVTYVVQRFTSLATLFFLLSLTAYVQARLALDSAESRRLRAIGAYVLSVLAAVAAMKTKEIAFTLPIVAAAYDLLFLPGGKRRFLLAPLAAAALLVPIGVASEHLSFADVLGDGGWLAETRDISRWTYLLTETRVVATYLRLVVFPVGQNVDHDFRLSDSAADPSVLFSAAVLLAIVAMGVVLLVHARRSNRAEGLVAFLGVAWFFATVSVESSVIPIRDVIFEHRTYLPLAGGVFTLAVGLLRAAEVLPFGWSPAGRAAVVVLLTAAPLGVATYARNRVWRDGETLWSDAAAKSPRKVRPRVNLGHAYELQGRLGDAERELTEALRTEPGRASARLNLGVVHRRQGRLDEAIRDYREAVRLAPISADAHYDLGVALYAKSDLPEAERAFREAIRVAPGLAEAHYNLGSVCARTGRLDDAIREYREAIRLAPSKVDVHRSLALAHEAKGELDDALHEYRLALRLDPRSAAAHAGLGGVLLALGQLGDAEGAQREALRLEPRDAESHFALGFILAAQRRLEEAIPEYERAIDLDPRAEFGLNLAVALDDVGRSSEAITRYQRFLDQAGAKDLQRSAEIRARLAQLRAPQRVHNR